MDHFRESHPDKRVVFVVASDDYRWCKRNFRNSNDTFMASSVEAAELRNKGNEVGFDLAVVARCQHAILR
jgi:hypothetical protein